MFLGHKIAVMDNKKNILVSQDTLVEIPIMQRKSTRFASTFDYLSAVKELGNLNSQWITLSMDRDHSLMAMREASNDLLGQRERLELEIQVLLSTIKSRNINIINNAINTELDSIQSAIGKARELEQQIRESKAMNVTPMPENVPFKRTNWRETENWTDVKIANTFMQHNRLKELIRINRAQISEFTELAFKANEISHLIQSKLKTVMVLGDRLDNLTEVVSGKTTESVEQIKVNNLPENAKETEELSQMKRSLSTTYCNDVELINRKEFEDAKLYLYLQFLVVIILQLLHY